MHASAVIPNANHWIVRLVVDIPHAVKYVWLKSPELMW